MSNASSSGQPAAQAPEHHADAPKRPTLPWGPWVSVIYAVVVFFAAQYVAGLFIYLYPLYHGWTAAQTQDWVNGSIVAQFIYILLAESLTFGAIWWFIRRKKGSLRLIGWRWPRWKDPVYTLAGYAAYFALFALMLMAAKALVPGLNLDQKQELGFDHVAGSANLVLTFLSLVVLPPIVEETVFRGFVFTGLLTKLKPLWAGLATSALFAAAHLQFGSGAPLLWVAGLDTFVLSLVLCYLRYKTDSLWPGIFLHALKNAIAFLTLYVFVGR
ncbi:MAG TPA: type II CAAX endopeptidase family protein [Candidatus Saccharimonadales bacterium]|nr:type II CAAX endopeptidase family protein [Candidatus Saccharimonadales bacterium]